MAEKNFRTELERKIFDLILTFPDRIDAMETRNEESVRRLARRIQDLVTKETRAEGPPDLDRPPDERGASTS